jgi:hypothetical protein
MLAPQTRPGSSRKRTISEAFFGYENTFFCGISGEGPANQAEKNKPTAGPTS